MADSAIPIYVTVCLYARNAYMNTGLQVCVPMLFKNRNRIQIQNIQKIHVASID